MARRWTDDADWSGYDLKSNRIKHGKYLFAGYPHVTVGEQALARLLTRQGIPYTPDVRFTFRDETGRRGVVFVPDFVFNKTAYIWEGIRGRRFLIHGIEVKRASRGYFRKKEVRKVKLLKWRRGINILLMSHRQIRYFGLRGKLPLRVPRMRRQKKQWPGAQLRRP